MMEKKGDSKNTRRIISAVFMALALIGIAYASLHLIAQARERQAHKASIESVRQDAKQAPQNDANVLASADAPAATETPRAFEGWLADYARQPDRLIDFATLKERNPDVYAWIFVPGTDVDFPILHAEKNDWHYLKEDIDLQANDAGAIFTDGWNPADFSDPLTLVYGHNMKDGTMFATLHRYCDAKFFEEHPSIFIYQDDYMLEYQVFAAYETSDDHILAMNDFHDKTTFDDYLSGIFEIRDINANLRKMELTSEDRIVTLVSSVLENDNARYFVQGVLVKNGERNAS